MITDPQPTTPQPTEPRVTFVPLQDQHLVAVYRALQREWRALNRKKEKDPGENALLKIATGQALASLVLLAPDDLLPALGLGVNETFPPGLPVTNGGTGS